MSTQEQNMVAALARHERAQQAVASLTRATGEALAKCPVIVELGDWSITNSRRDELTAPGGRSKTHLWHAFQHREPSDCGYGEQGLCEDGIDDALSPGSEFECEHCLQAWRLIVERKEARQELGKAKRLIRFYGKKAISMLGGEA